ncbi:hypothetical protein B0J12DRAFT_656126 [Macrophomina phaseolina]|uniref:Pentatricopeptide repeat-containing protein n=1 Tax=Macrophomina phaseolina TaxID=35725 RepID=A0ABQ8GKH5_9PEZI|nr:hypothetical protein B0J12DRAFT_656126 [Macrophomina phaseolina]
MTAPYVCPSCRRNVLRHGINFRGLPRTSKATFISFTSTNSRKVPKNENADKPSNADEGLKRTATETLPERRPLHSRLAQSSSRADALSNLFNVLDITNPNARGKYSGTAIGGSDAQQPRSSFQRNRLSAAKSQIPQQKPVATELDAILNTDKTTTVAAWEYFLDHYPSPDCETLKSPSLLDVRQLVEGNIFRKLLRALINDWCVGKTDDALPEPVQVVERFMYLGIMCEESWRTTLWSLNMHALKRSNGTEGKHSGKSLNETMSQLMKLWDKLFKQFASSASSPLELRPSDRTELPVAMWSALPSPVAAHEASRRQQYFGSRLHEIFPNMSFERVNRISYSALVTYDILIRDGIESVLDQRILSEFRPFVVFLAHLIAGCYRLPVSRIQNSSNDMQFQLEGAHISPEDITALFNRIVGFRLKTRNIIGSSGLLSEMGRESRRPEESLQDFYFKSVARAYSYGKPQQIHQLWLDVCQSMPRKAGDSSAVEIPPKLYNLFLEAFMALKQPDRAIQIWNHMIENGTHPTVKAWTAMLTGCGKAKDIYGLEQMWVRMLNSGIQPDAHAWSSRIFGIMSAGKTEHGLRVLEEMGKIWVEACKRVQAGGKKKSLQVDEANLPARPSTVVLNGAITALSQMPPRHHRYIARVLAWGRSFGIAPDVFTFNALISLSLKRDNAPEAMKLLQQMEEAQVQPDIATFTIILNSIFRNPSTAALSQEEQNEKVMDVLQNLEAKGIQANAHVYSTLIDGLLKRHDNQQAAKAVLNHMVAKKIAIPPHIYTILMTYYFQREDFDSIEALWTQIQSSGTVVDMVFYDRMIERYAAIGDTGKMTTFLTRMSKEGLTPGWPALQAVVVKLADIGDWERFDEIVYDVENGVGIATKGLRKSDENVINRFWAAVEYKKKQRPKPETEQAHPVQAL